MRATRCAHLRAIVFDVDGTLADTEEIHRQAFNATFREYGLDWFWNPQVYQRLLAISGGRERMTHYAAEQPDAGPLAPTSIPEMHRRKTACYAALLETGRVPLRPGVIRLLREAREAGLKLAIATSSARSNLDTLLDLNLPPDWRTWFAAIETCETTPEKKPSPALYLAALRGLGLGAGECLALEDTRNGLLAAHAAGLCTVVTTHRYTRHEDFDDAALVVDGLGEPGRPPHVLRGSLRSQPCVTLDLLDELLAGRGSSPHP